MDGGDKVLELSRPELITVGINTIVTAHDCKSELAGNGVRLQFNVYGNDTGIEPGQEYANTNGNDIGVGPGKE